MKPWRLIARRAWRFAAPALLLAALMSGEAPVLAAPAGGIDPSTLKPLQEAYEGGYIDWQNGVYYAQVSAPVPDSYRGRQINQAFGRELAERVTGALADSVFLRLVANTRVDAENTLRQLVKDKAEIRLTGNIAGKQLVSSKLVTQAGKQVLAATYKVDQRGVSGVIANLHERVVKADATQPRAQTKAGDAPILLIDARGLGLRPALFPRVLSADGQLVYDASVAGKQKTIASGVIEYAVSPDTEQALHPAGKGRYVYARAIEFSHEKTNLLAEAGQAAGETRGQRAKRTPIRAAQAAGPLRANIIVGNEDAARLIKAAGDYGGFHASRVLVVTDGTVGGTEGKGPDGGYRWAVFEL